MIELILGFLMTYAMLILLSFSSNTVSKVIWMPFLMLTFQVIEMSFKIRKLLVEGRRGSILKKKIEILINNKFTLVIITLVITLLLTPVGFNYLFLWESGFSRGETSDWFVLYGDIFGGLIGGLFTYLALVLTLNNQKKEKSKEMRPRIDIPYKSIDFIDGTDVFSNQIAIELNNIGGTIAKNIECKLSLTNFDEVISTIEENKERLRVEIKNKNIHSVSLIKTGDSGKKSSLGTVNKSYKSRFIGSCIPLILNHSSKVTYLLEYNVNQWIDYIAKHRNNSGYNANDKINNELFTMELEVKYSSAEYGEITDKFKLEWDYIGIWADSDGTLKFQYVLKSTLETK